LSTFWKRRLNLLESARSAPPALTRRDCLKLGTAGVAACALPTFRAASAVGLADAKAATPGKIYMQAKLKVGKPDEEGVDGIFAVDPETGKAVKVSDETMARVRISPDRRTLAISRSGWTGTPMHEIPDVGLWTLDIEGKGTAHKIADFGGEVSWSPDSKQLVVVRERMIDAEKGKRVNETWRFDLDGKSRTKLPIPETDSVADWSPDGEWFVVTSSRRDTRDNPYQLYLMHPDGTGSRQLTEGKESNVHPLFSPDGRKVVYEHSERGGNSIWVVNVDGTNRHRIFREEDDWSIGNSIVWSPDGRSILFSDQKWSRDEKGKKFMGAEKTPVRITIMNADGTNRRPLALPPIVYVNFIDWR
jgi:Tol biopolymer transport system component